MFRHQTHPYHYQTTVVTRSDAQFQQSNQQRVKYPWLEHPAPECQSQISSNDDTYHLPHEHNPSAYSDGLSSPVYHTPEYANNQYQVLHLPEYRGSSERLPGGCGGHCPGFEYVCYYVLQIIFVIGILTGISLCIAGSVLRRTNRGGDLGVLVYIGCLAASVCAVLLGVQCCVRRKNKQRCKHLRTRTAVPDCIPLDTIPNALVAEMQNQAQNPPRQMQPLLHPPAPTVANSTLPRSYYRPERRLDGNSSTFEDISGVPWWRRQ